MLELSPRVGALKSSPASVLAKKARELKATGREIILLSSGELHFPTPDHVIDAAVRAARAVPVGYTDLDGSSELKDAICEKFVRENGLSFSRDQVIVCNGSKQVMFNALMATLLQGDEVIVPSPYWASYLDMVNFAGGTPVIAATVSGKLSAEELDRSIGPQTRWLILNNPVNPTGDLYTAAELSSLGEVLDRYPRVMVMSDDLYEHILFDNAVFATMAQAVSRLAGRTLTVNGVSKAYAMMGWRIGYGVGNRDLISAMTKVQSQSTSSASTVSQAAAEAALRGSQASIRNNMISLSAARERTIDAIRAIPGLTVERPSGTFYAYVNCVGLLATRAAGANGLFDDRDVARFLLDEAGVVVLPGADCGLSPYFRINFACAPTTLDTALDRIAGAIGGLA